MGAGFIEKISFHTTYHRFLKGCRNTILWFCGWSFFFSAAWTAYEFILSNFTFFNIGAVGTIVYTRMENLPMLCLATVTGLWGISFLLNLLPAGVTLGIYFRKDRRVSVSAYCIPLGLLCLSVIFGVYCLNEPMLPTAFE